MTDMDVQVDQLRALAAVVDTGSFESAAQHLRITQSAVSQRIKALERSVGQVLLIRSRPVRVTEPGTAVLRLARELDLLVAATGQELALARQSGGGARPRLVLVANADSLATWMMPALADAAQHLDLEVLREDQDHSVALLRDGTAMAAVTSQREPVQGCSATPLGSMRYRPRASADFARNWFSDGVTPAALAAAPVVHFDRKDDLQAGYLRAHASPGARPPRHFVPGPAEFAAALRLGMGWGMLPDVQAAQPGNESLVVIDPQAVADVALVWQRWTMRTEPLRLLTDAVLAQAARALR